MERDLKPEGDRLQRTGKGEGPVPPHHRPFGQLQLQLPLGQAVNKTRIPFNRWAREGEPQIGDWYNIKIEARAVTVAAGEVLNHDQGNLKTALHGQTA